jgi:hypothetical protein
MSPTKAWAIDISLVSDFAADASGPMQLSLPSSLHLEAGALVALMDMGRCCGLGTVREQSLLVLPVNFEPNLLISPQYEPTELQAEDRIKLFGHDEAHLRRMLSSIAIAPTAHALGAVAAAAPSSPRFWKIAPGPSGIAWPEWRKRGIAAIGWPDLGDVSTVTEDEFQARSKAKYDKVTRAVAASPVQRGRGVRWVGTWLSKRLLPTGTVMPSS